MLSLFISWCLTPFKKMKITHGKRVAVPSHLSTVLAIIKTLEKLLKLCWLMVAEKLLVNSIMKIQKEDKRGKARELSKSEKKTELVKLYQLLLIWKFILNFNPSKFRNLSHFNKELTCHGHPLLSAEEKSGSSRRQIGLLKVWIVFQRCQSCSIKYTQTSRQWWKT